MIEDVKEAEQKMTADGLGFRWLQLLTYAIASLLITTTALYIWYGGVYQSFVA